MRFFTIIFLLSVSAIAQDKDDAMKKLSAETCKLMKDADVNMESVNMMDFQMLVGESFNKAYLLDTAYYNDNGIKISMDDTRVNIEIGIDLGEQLVAECPYFKELSMVAQRNASAQLNPSLAQQLRFVTGKVLEVKSGMFPTLIVENEQGDRQEFLWITKVEDTNLLEKAIREKSIIEFEFDMEELYDANSKDYKSKMVLKSVKKL